MQLDFAFLKFAKNLKNCFPTVLHLTYVFLQTWHLMDQTWYFCIGTMAWQFWYPRILDSLSCPYSPRRSSFPRYESSCATILFPSRAASFFLRVASTLGLLPRSDLDDLDQAATWTCGTTQTREKISHEDERFPDKNGWVHYFGKCQVKNAKHLEMNLYFLWQNV